MKFVTKYVPKALLIRLLVFAGLFIAVTAVIGPGVVRSRLLYDFGFYIYGNMGKVLLFGCLLWVLMVRDKLHNLPTPIFNKIQLLFVVMAFFSAGLFSVLKDLLVSQAEVGDNLGLFIGTHVSLLAIPVLLLLGVFGWQFVKETWRLVWQETMIVIGLSILFYFLIFQVWKLWPFFSAGVLWANEWMFGLYYDKVAVYPPRTLLVDDFAVVVAESCSGLDSLFLFSALYVVIGILDWKKFVAWKWFLLLPVAMVGLFVVNIVRVFLLIWVGVEWSEELAWNLFHSYLGMVMFVIYFGVFWKFAYGWMASTKQKGR